MNGTLNEVNIIGYLGKDPEIRTMQSGKENCQLSIATSQTWKNQKAGDDVVKTEWHRIVIYSPGLIKLCREHLAKGDRVLIRGILETRKWQDKSGIDKYTTEVVVSGPHSKLSIINCAAWTGQDKSTSAYSQLDPYEDYDPCAIV